MNDRIGELVERIRKLEEEIETELSRRRAEFNADFESRKVRFERGVIARQRRFKEGLARYVFGARPLVLLSAPVITPFSATLRAELRRLEG